MQAQQVFIGVDVARDSLVISIGGAPKPQVVANDEPAIKRWIKTLPPQAVIAMESTGCYHQRLARLTHQAGLRVYVLNAKDVYFYAKALGARGKTDPLDAQILARYVAEHHEALHPWLPGTPAQAGVQELLQRRARVAVCRASLRQTLAGMKKLTPAVLQLEKRFDKLLQRIDREVQALLDSEPKLSQGSAVLQSICGIGPQSAAMLVALLNRIQFANADALVAYSGLDPRPSDSGMRSGKRRLSKRGSPGLRRQLYLAALAATRSKALGPTYQALRAKGFKSTQAVVILARKLLRIAWAVWKSGKPFDAAKLTRVA
jgi:transposase